MKGKALRAKSFPLVVFALIGLIFSASVVQGTATHTISLPHGDFFEVSDPISTYIYDNETVYEPTWQAEIDLINLVWNQTTTNPTIHLKFASNASVIRFVQMSFAKPNENGTGNVVISSNSTGTGFVAHGTHLYTESSSWEIKLTIKEDETIVKNSTDTLVDFYRVGEPIENMSRWSATGYALTAGHMNVQFSEGGDYGLDLLYQMFPVFMALALIGSIFKYAKRLGK